MKYRKKPVVIEAIQWTGKNIDEMAKFYPDGELELGSEIGEPPFARMVIHTLEGIMRADIGDYIIKGVKGEYYPCKPDVFEMTYEAVEE